MPNVRRVVPDIRSDNFDGSRDFYGALGLEEVMNEGWIMFLASPTNPIAQLLLQGPDARAPEHPDLSIEVDDVDAAYAVMLERKAEIIHPLQDEEWGVRRFFVRDPNGRVVNVVRHQ